MKYRYFARTEDNSEQEGTIEAPSKTEAQAILARRDIIATRIEEEKTHIQKKKKPASRIIKSLFKRKASEEELANLSYELSILLESGLNLPDALTLYAGESGDYFDEELRSVVEEVRGGTPFSEALHKRQRDFPPVFSAMVHSGEKAGNLPSVLQVLSRYFEKMESIKSQVISAASYPIFVAMLAFMVILSLVIFIVPIFARIYEHLGIHLPLATRIFLSIGQHRDTVLVTLIVIAAAMIGVSTLAGRSGKGREQIDRIKLSLWLLGPIFRDVALTNFSVTLGMLCENGLRLHEAIDLAAEACGNVYMEKTLKSLKKSLYEGRALSQILSERDIMDSRRLGMVKAGERSGNIGEVLMKLSDIIFNQVDHKIKRLLGLLEPAMVLVIGIAVGGAIISLALPILNLSSFLNK